MATMSSVEQLTSGPGTLLERLRAFALPGGADAARGVLGVKTTQVGEIRSAPGARWISYTADETIDATRSGFRWDARLRTGPLRILSVTDAYEDGHGKASIKLGGVVPVASGAGPDYDKGELQRYLAEIVCCPPILLNHPSLEWEVAGPRTLRVRDRQDETGASIELDVGDDGRPLAVRADRPRTVGKRTVLTPWSGRYDEMRQWDGLMVPTRIQAAWQLPEGEFVYVRAEMTSLVLLR